MNFQEVQENEENWVVFNHDETVRYILMFRRLLSEIREGLRKFLEGGVGYSEKRKILYFLRLVENQKRLSSIKINNLWDLVFSEETEMKKKPMYGERSSPYGANIVYDGCVDVDARGFPKVNLVDFNGARNGTY